MKHRTANCPTCAAPVEFKTGSSLVTVCEFCSTAVGRGDRDVTDLGKVSDVGEPSSGLHRGMTGKWKGKSFTIVGRVRYRHSGGGSWDEWYLAFAGDRWGWLAESQGQFALTVQRKLSSSARLPEFDSISVDQTIPLKGVPLQVREKGVAVAEGAEGEMPWPFKPGADHLYVDLYGDDGAVATFEYGDGSDTSEQSAFLGNVVTLEQLEIDLSSLDPNAGKIKVDALQLSCPKCGGQLALRAPDQSLRVACPNCTSLLDAKEGKLSLFQSLYQEKVKPEIPLGSEGMFGDVSYIVIGFMERYAKYAGKTYPWREYLLHNDQLGFRWLVENNGHWSIAGPVDSPPEFAGDKVHYDGDTYRIYDRGTAYVRYVVGEFYWRVNVGDQVTTADYIAPPKMLSYERSGWGDTQETTVSVGYYLQPEELEAIFGVTDLKRSWGVGVIEPSPNPGWKLYAMWAGFFAYLVAVVKHFGGNNLDGWLMFYAFGGVSLIPGLVLTWLYMFEVSRWSESDYSPYASGDD